VGDNRALEDNNLAVDQAVVHLILTLLIAKCLNSNKVVVDNNKALVDLNNKPHQDNNHQAAVVDSILQL
jgi:hypothetical protein